jgi:hypothetical protein
VTYMIGPPGIDSVDPYTGIDVPYIPKTRSGMERESVAGELSIRVVVWLTTVSLYCVNFVITVAVVTL